ncbi:unnamed protein product [Brassica rapa]|uniref:Uncharacterized protein n=1 Tax=Brassica campestris TaxID=3711 RepID=A0A3P5Z2U9_BRACM|nr:unnamed protein product [Brassica rapa]VDC67321.1 unnamed protein product [Brassica rapa]
MSGLRTQTRLEKAKVENSSFLSDTIFRANRSKSVFRRRRRPFSSSSLLFSVLVRTHTVLSMAETALAADAGLITTGTDCFSGDSWKALSPDLFISLLHQVWLHIHLDLRSPPF